MDVSPSPRAHKRGKLLQQQLYDSSPLSGASALSPSKRRRLDNPVSSPSTPKALQALRNAFGGVFGLTKSNEDVDPAVNESSDELAVENRQIEEEEREGLDQEHSGDELGSPSRRSHGSGQMPDELDENSTPKAKQKKKRGKTKKTQSQDQRSSHVMNGSGSTLAVSNYPEDRESFLAGRSSPDGTDAPQDQALGSSRASSANMEDISGLSGRSSGRQRRMPRRYSNEIVNSPKTAPKSILTPSKKGRDSASKKSKKFVAFDTITELQDELSLGFRDIPSSTSKKDSKILAGESERILGKKPGHEFMTIEATDAEKNDDRSEVSVELDREADPQGGQEESMRDSSPSEELMNDDGDDVCAKCGNGDSEDSNEIVFCENCNIAVHQACYGIPVIPEGDWYCDDCRPVEALQNQGDIDMELMVEGLVETSRAPEIEGGEQHLQVMQKLLLDKLTGRKPFQLHGLDDEYRNLHQVMEQTVLAGEGNSMLVIGARSSGKTALAEKVISDLSTDHREEFHVVRLNGFIHTDDKLALREIWRQLGRDMEVEDDLVSKTNNYADTLTSLLALLSHPSELSEDNKDHTAKSIIFILDEFDLFASHPRQTLLYNLFDIAQARKAPIAVIGLTTRIDVVESLEKRVKSRFSHRYVHLPLPRNLPAYWEICKQGLLISEDELREEGLDPAAIGQKDFLQYWGTMIEDLYNDDRFKTHVQTLYYRSKSIPAFLVSCILPISNLTPHSLPLTSKSFFGPSSLSLAPPDSKLHLLQGLAELDLALLICAARLDIVFDTDTCNFAMAYDEYSSLTSRHKIQTSSTGVAALGSSAKVWGKEVAIGAWERLIECELLLPASMGGGQMGGTGGIGREGKMWKVDVGLEEIPGSVPNLSSIMTKWCKEI